MPSQPRSPEGRRGVDRARRAAYSWARSSWSVRRASKGASERLRSPTMNGRDLSSTRPRTISRRTDPRRAITMAYRRLARTGWPHAGWRAQRGNAIRASWRALSRRSMSHPNRYDPLTSLFSESAASATNVLTSVHKDLAIEAFRARPQRPGAPRGTRTVVRIVWTIALASRCSPPRSRSRSLPTMGA